MDNDFDLIVLGAGSGGLAAAKRAARYGARVAIVEGDRVGGTCVIRGCVPKKLLVYGSLYREYIDDASSYGVSFKDALIDSGVLLSNVRKEVDRLNELHIEFLKKAGVELFQGWGHFSGSHEVTVKGKESFQLDRELKGTRILISVGGTPTIPKIPGASLGWVSDDMFRQEMFPEKVVVVGAGFIACEFACILNRLGVKVIQLVRGKKLLRGFDNDLSAFLEENMRESGIELFFEQSPLSIKGKFGDLEISIKDHKVIECGGLLFATGRKPSIEGLALEVAGVKVTNSTIPVNVNHQTNVSHIFAIGDVIDRVNLTPVAIDAGRAFADNIYGNIKRIVDYELVASAVFSQPEIATIGLSEEKAILKYGKENIEVFRSVFRPMSKAIPKNGPRCLLKLVVNRNTDIVIGCHMVGEHAAEIVQMASIAITMGAKKQDFDRTMALHPTIAEEFVTMS